MGLRGWVSSILQYFAVFTGFVAVRDEQIDISPHVLKVTQTNIGKDTLNGLVSW
jgi:hypothetical protein